MYISVSNYICVTPTLPILCEPACSVVKTQNTRSQTEASGIRVVLKMDVPGSNGANLTKVFHFSDLRNAFEPSFKSKIVIERRDNEEKKCNYIQLI